MKITCSRSQLAEVLTNVSRAAAQKSPNKATQGILMKTMDSSIYICCYNLELGISKTLSAGIIRPGQVVLPIALCEYVRRMDGESISIECDEKYAVHISSGYASYDVIGIPANDFPELPVFNAAHSMSIEEGKLRSLLTQTSYAMVASTKQSMPIQYTGELFEISGGKLTIVALDGFRVALRSESIDCGDEYSFILPGKTINELIKLLSDSEDPVMINAEQTIITFSVDGYSILSRLMAGSFMNYRAAMNKEEKYTVEVNTSEFIAALERMSLIITEADKSPVCCLFSKSGVSFLCETDLSRAVDNIGCVSNIDEDVEMGFNNKYLLDALRASDNEKVRILLNDDSRKPIQILPVEGESFHYLLMPVLIRSGMFKKDNSKAPGAAYSPEDAPGTDAETDIEEEADFGTDYDD